MDAAFFMASNLEFALARQHLEIGRAELEKERIFKSILVYVNSDDFISRKTVGGFDFLGTEKPSVYILRRA